MTEQIDQILAEIITRKSNDGRSNLRVEGLNFVHPMHEAVMSTFKQNFTDPEICAIFAKDEKSLMAVIAAESFIDNLDAYKKNELKQLVISGAPLTEITTRAAIQLAENKRMQDGNILYNLERTCREPIADVIEALKKEPAKTIYVDCKRMEQISANAKEIPRQRATRKLKYSLSSFILAATIATSTGIFIHNKKDFIKEMTAKRSGYESVVSDLEKKSSQLTAAVAILDDKIKKSDEYEKQLTENQAKTSKSEDELRDVKSRYDKAKKEFSELESKATIASTAYTELAKKTSELETKANGYGEKVTGFSEDYFLLGCESYQLQKTEKALELLAKAIELNPNNSKAHNALGSIFVEKKEYEKARLSFVKAVEAEKENPTFRHNLAVCYAMKGDRTLAEREYLKTIELDSGNKLAHYNLGNLYLAYADKPGAIKSLKRFIELENNVLDTKFVEVSEKLKQLEEK